MHFTRAGVKSHFYFLCSTAHLDRDDLRVQKAILGEFCVFLHWMRDVKLPFRSSENRLRVFALDQHNALTAGGLGNLKAKYFYANCRAAPIFLSLALPNVAALELRRLARNCSELRRFAEFCPPNDGALAKQRSSLAKRLSSTPNVVDPFSSARRERAKRRSSRQTSGRQRVKERGHSGPRYLIF